jgi:hypothetical protein
MRLRYGALKTKSNPRHTFRFECDFYAYDGSDDDATVNILIPPRRPNDQNIHRATELAEILTRLKDLDLELETDENKADLKAVDEFMDESPGIVFWPVNEYNGFRYGLVDFSITYYDIDGEEYEVNIEE